MGQNFLIDETSLNKVVEAAELDQNDTILEIGPGMGVLTQALAKTVKKVVAIEKDPVMVSVLQETLKSYDNIELRRGDALKFPNSQLPMTNYKVVANIPYYLTSPIIRMFLETDNPPKCMVLMIQKEVAQRICAKPPDMSLLAVSVQFYASAKIISYISKNCFWPTPKVDSAIIKITPLETKKPASSAGRDVDATAFFTVVKAGFSQPRKQLANNLSKALNMDRDEVNTWLMKNSIESKQRAETLSVEDWIELTLSKT